MGKTRRLRARKSNFKFLNTVNTFLKTSSKIMVKKRGKTNKDVYEKVEDLPESRKERLDSILEDFDKEVAARIEQINSAITALQTQIKSQFKVTLLKEPRNIRHMKVEDFYYNSEDDDQAIADKLNITVECAKVAMAVNDQISNEVKTNVKSKGKKGTSKTSKKKSSILAQGPALSGTGMRRSTRKRTAPSWISETPLASSTLTAAALGCTTSKSTRTKGRLVPSTPGFGNITGIPMITPKFDLTTPLSRTAMRTQRADEKFLVSINGSPVYVQKKTSKSKNNLIPVPLGDGKTLMVPADNPEVQPMLQNLIKSCMNIMNRK